MLAMQIDNNNNNNNDNNIYLSPKVMTVRWIIMTGTWRKEQYHFYLKSSICPFLIGEYFLLFLLHLTGFTDKRSNDKRSNDKRSKDKRSNATNGQIYKLQRHILWYTHESTTKFFSRVSGSFN